MNSICNVYWAKSKEDVIIPTKRAEDAGFDIYANFDTDYVMLKPHETKKISTGLYGATDPDHEFILKERGSTGTIGLAQRSGVMDSGYRGEWFIPITNTSHDTTIFIVKKEFLDKNATEALKFLRQVAPKDTSIRVYPYEKAICQAIPVAKPMTVCRELDLEDFKNIPSERGDGALGSSGK